MATVANDTERHRRPASSAKSPRSRAHVSRDHVLTCGQVPCGSALGQFGQDAADAGQGDRRMARSKNARASAYRHLTHMLLRSDGLLERAEVALAHAVAADPTNATALLRLGDVHRGKGRFGSALDCYRCAASLRPDDPRARWLVAVAGGTALPLSPPPAMPAAFVRHTDFLPPHRCRQLLSLALAHRDGFVPPKPTINTPKGEVDAAVRTGPVLLHPVTDREVRPWFEARLRDAFASALSRLRRRTPRAYRVEMAMSAFLAGDYIAKHNDNRYRDRRLSFAYYFHRQPRPFSGGELLLHDAGGNAFTSIEPQHNSIVFFPPESIHEVAPVKGDRDDFGAARFTLQGWLTPCAAAGGEQPRQA